MRNKLYTKQGDWPGLLDKEGLAANLERMARGIRTGSIAPEEAGVSTFVSREESSINEFKFTYYEKLDA